MNRFTDRVAIVTGGGSGIGAATVRRLASEGASVLVADLDEGMAAQVARSVVDEGGSAVVHPLDVRSRKEVEAVVSKALSIFGRLDLMHNNAGIAPGQALSEMSQEVVGQILDVNLIGVINGVAAAGVAMCEGDGGSIVNTSSLAAIVAVPNQLAYSASKGGVLSLTRAAAVEYAPTVRCNAVLPGPIRTPINDKSRGRPTTDEDVQRVAAMQLVRRMGQPEEVAAAVAFLGSEDASFITGTYIVVDGGLSAAIPYPS
ncbi:MAG: SDR family oxidoreductase [Ilumatobacteraceae bacterium]